MEAVPCADLFAALQSPTSNDGDCVKERVGGVNNWPARFYVKRWEVWGGGYHWQVLERGGKGASPASGDEVAIRALCDRMNADWRRYELAMWDLGRIWDGNAQRWRQAREGAG